MAELRSQRPSAVNHPPSRPGRPTVIYIAGYGRSGSTLLDIILSQHAAVISGGELAFALESWRNPDEVCACGRRIAACDLWRRVSRKVLSWIEVAALSQDRLSALQQRAESRCSAAACLAHRGWPLSAFEKEVYRQFQIRLFTGIVEAQPGSRYVIDSSKTASRAACRPLALYFLSELPVRIIHLVRDPRAVLKSLMRGTNRSLEAGQADKSGIVPLRGMLGWIQANFFASVTSRLVPQENFLMVRYEDLLSDTDRVVRRICRFIGLDPSSITAALRQNHLPEEKHTLAGNRMRFGNVRLDPSRGGNARQDLPWHFRSLCLALCWPMIKKFGYPMW